MTSLGDTGHSFPLRTGPLVLPLSLLDSEPLVSLLTKNNIIKARNGMASYPHFTDGEAKVVSQAIWLPSSSPVLSMLGFYGHTKLHAQCWGMGEQG